jgi:hypothetical protein
MDIEEFYSNLFKSILEQYRENKVNVVLTLICQMLGFNQLKISISDTYEIRGCQLGVALKFSGGGRVCCQVLV